MRGIGLAGSLLLALALALPEATLARADVGHNRQHSIGAQAVFDTAVTDDAGRPVPGIYLNVFATVAIDTYVIDGERVESTALVATITRYAIDSKLDWVFIDSFEAWTYDPALNIGPSLKSATGTGVLAMHACGWDENGPYCTYVGDAQLSVAFSATNPMHDEPMHYTEVFPGPNGYVYTTHRAAHLRYATATGKFDGQVLGNSLNGNFFQTHEGEVFVTRTPGGPR